MVIKNVSLDIVCGITSKLPDTDRPEVAFAGKSNVGKSSLINGLMNRKSLARTSAQPGKTQTINFYNINEAMYLVDLPGYGYAKVSQSEKEKWGKMIERYLHTSKNLKAVFLLIDIRHDPSANDKMMYDWILNNGYEPIIIATKLDKLKRSPPERASFLFCAGKSGLFRLLRGLGEELFDLGHAVVFLKMHTVGEHERRRAFDAVFAA